jgi:hypothetical protein
LTSYKLILFYRGSFLNSETSVKNIENTEKAETEEFSGDTRDIVLRARKEYGRYFGVCSSYHHLKACLCKYCSAYPGGTGMFCTRGGAVVREGNKENCLCETCELFKKFRFEGDYFCQVKEKGEVFERKYIPPNTRTYFQTSAGTIRVCILDNKK